jgi:hypothetical protein
MLVHISDVPARRPDTQYNFFIAEVSEEIGWALNKIMRDYKGEVIYHKPGCPCGEMTPGLPFEKLLEDCSCDYVTLVMHWDAPCPGGTKTGFALVSESRREAPGAGAPWEAPEPA